MNKTINEVRSIRGSLKYMMPIFLMVVFLLAWVRPSIVLATTVTGTTVNYLVDYADETLRVTAGPGGSTKFYISFDKQQRTWEDIHSSGLVDISTILSSKKVDIYIKGNKDTAFRTVTLMEEPNTVTTAYVIKNGEGSITYSASGTAIEYRKGSNGAWKTPPAVFLTYLYEVKGATLQFRSVANTGARAGKIITVKIPKRPSPPSVKFDGSKLLVSGIKANDTQYFNPTTGLWQYVTTDSKVKTVSLYTLSNTSSVANTPIAAGAYEFRSNAGEKKVLSGAKLIEVPLQPICPTTIKLEGATLTVTDDAKRAFEYCRLAPSSTFNPATVKWSSIPTNKATVLKNTYAQEQIFVRLKATVDKKTKLVTPASTYIVLTVK